MQSDRLTRFDCDAERISRAKQLRDGLLPRLERKRRCAERLKVRDGLSVEF
jgi:hypothetical protein